MLYIVYLLLFTLVTICVLVFLRKIQYDRTHQNLLDLRDKIGGEVLRKSFLNQPKFQGEYKKFAIQIAFSGDKIKKQRVSYICYSFSKNFHPQTTIATKIWFEDMEQEFKASSKLFILDRFVIRSDSSKQIKKLKKMDGLIEKLKSLEPFAYIMFTRAGLMCEIKSDQIVVDIEKDNVLRVLEAIVNLIVLIQ